MNRKTLISLTAIFIAATAATNVNAQDITPKKISVGPAIDFGRGTSFGIQGQIPIGSNFSVRPIVLFGYQTAGRKNVTGSGSGSTSAELDAAGALAVLNARLASPPLPLSFSGPAF